MSRSHGLVAIDALYNSRIIPATDVSGASSEVASHELRGALSTQPARIAGVGCRGRSPSLKQPENWLMIGTCRPACLDGAATLTPMRAAIGTLILATSLIQLANGFFGTFISLRVAIEDFGPTLAGVVLSSYFAGFTLAAMRCSRIIERVGHIRAYAAFAGVVAAATAAMPLWVGPITWLVLRAVVGFGCAGLFITTESWLNAKAAPNQRGRVFAIYMVGTFAALAAGQLLIAKAAVAGPGPFNAIVALFAVGLVMVSTTRAEPPQATGAPILPLRQLARAAPIAVIGSGLSGIIAGAFYALVPASMQDKGNDRSTIAQCLFAY